jgi:hypothetical protein
MCHNGQFCPLFSVAMSAKTDTFIQKYICRLFTLKMILVDIMQV